MIGLSQSKLSSFVHAVTQETRQVPFILMKTILTKVVGANVLHERKVNPSTSGLFQEQSSADSLGEFTDSSDASSSRVVDTKMNTTL